MEHRIIITATGEVTSFQAHHREAVLEYMEQLMWQSIAFKYEFA